MLHDITHWILCMLLPIALIFLPRRDRTHMDPMQQKNCAKVSFGGLISSCGERKKRTSHESNKRPEGLGFFTNSLYGGFHN